MTHDTAPLLCGTYAGYIRHIKKTKDTPCDECRAAATLYMRLYRKRDGRRPRELAAQEDRRRAMARLARMHPTEYRALVMEERQNRQPNPDPACPCWRPRDGGQCSTCGEVQGP